MRITNFGGRKDTLRLLGMMLLVVVLVIFNYFATNIPPGEEAQFIERLFVGEESLVSFLARAFPPAAFATRALSAPPAVALLNYLAYLLINLAAITLMFLLADRLFYRGLIGGEEISARKSISARELEKRLTRSSSPVWAIALREIKILVRTPIYLFNSVGMLLLLPVLLLVPALARGGIGPILQQFQNFEQRLILNLGAAAFIGGMALFTPASSSSFSREGKNFWISKIIPVEPAVQIRGKILYSYLIALLAVPLIVLFSLFAARFSLSELVMVILLGAALSFPAITLSLLVDILRPYLDWDNPQKAIKQNLNVVLGMVAGGAAFYLVYLAGRLVFERGAADLYIYLAVLLTSLFLGAVPYAILVRIAEARYRNTGS
jgi:ABC-2 type transport system permease protein